jgi:putative acetyltransferase
MLVRRETAADLPAIVEVTRAAFARADAPDTEPVEVTLLAELRETADWLPRLSMVATENDRVVGHVVASRGRIDGAPVAALGPLSVHPDHQRRGVGLALVHTLLGAAEALDEPAVVLLGSPDYYRRFGFRAASDLGIQAPVPAWGRYFQVRPLAGYRPGLTGAFRYSEPFDRT